MSKFVNLSPEGLIDMHVNVDNIIMIYFVERATNPDGDRYSPGPYTIIKLVGDKTLYVKKPLKAVLELVK